MSRKCGILARLILGLMAGLQRLPGHAEPVNVGTGKFQPVVVTRHRIEKGEPLTAEALTLKKVPSGHLPQGVLDSVEEAQGCIAVRSLPARTVLRRQDLGHREVPSQVAKIPPGPKILTVKGRSEGSSQGQRHPLILSPSASAAGASSSESVPLTPGPRLFPSRSSRITLLPSTRGDAQNPIPSPPWRVRVIRGTAVKVEQVKR